MVLAPLHREVSAVFSSETLFGTLFVAVETLPPDLIRRRLVPSMLGKLIFPFGAVAAMVIGTGRCEGAKVRKVKFGLVVDRGGAAFCELQLLSHDAFSRVVFFVVLRALILFRSLSHSS
jgi:hypothetical protein